MWRVYVMEDSCVSSNSRKDQELAEPDKEGEQIDFKHLYNLPSDRITSISEAIEEPQKRIYPKTSFEDLQKHVADIQLIPKVPDPVKRVFKCAKDLYIFGHFRYIFFTVSSHYAFLAVESALKHRYIQSLGGKAVVVGKNRKVDEIVNPTYQRIEEFCWQKELVRSQKKVNSGSQSRAECFQFEIQSKPQKVTVNGEPFPHSMRKLLDWMVEKGIIAKSERLLYDSSKRLRNGLSHLEFAPILIPNPVALARVAYQINRLFHQMDEKH
jgi:hypothetical protein